MHPDHGWEIIFVFHGLFHFVNKVRMDCRLKCMNDVRLFLKHLSTLTRYIYRKMFFVLKHIWYGNSHLHHMLKIESSNFQMMTYRSTSLSDDDASQRCFGHGLPCHHSIWCLCKLNQRRSLVSYQSEHGKELNINPFLAMCNAKCYLWTWPFDVGKYN